MSFWSKLLSPVTDIVNGHLERRHEIKKAKLATAIKKEEAKQARYMREVEMEADWDMGAMRASRDSIKDEVLLFVLAAPFVCSFLPWTQEYVLKGWEYVGKAPGWYQLSFIGVIAASFGLRWLFNKQKKQDILNDLA